MTINLQALRWSNLFLLSKEASAQGAITKADRALIYPTVYATIDDLLARFPESDQTLLAHEEVLWHFENERFDYATGEVWAHHLIDRFPNTRQAAVALIDLAEMGVQLRWDFDAAYPLLEQALEWAHANDDWDLAIMAVHIRGRLLNKQCCYDDARDVLQETLTLIDEHAEGEWLRIQTEAEYAASYIEEGYRMRLRDKAAARTILAKAAEEYAAIVERYPDDPGWTPYLKHQIGLAHFHAHDMQAAKEAFFRLVADHPDDGWAWAAFNYMDLGMERPERPDSVRMPGGEQ